MYTLPQKRIQFFDDKKVCKPYFYFQVKMMKILQNMKIVYPDSDAS